MKGNMISRHIHKINKSIHQAHLSFLRYAQTHPKTLTTALLGGTTIVGIVLFKIIDDDDAAYMRDPKQKMSIEEAQLIAMLENAKDSSWQDNLENAVSAHEQFMLPGRNRDTPKFMDQIDRRSLEIMKNHHKKIDKENMRRETTTKFWSNYEDRV